MKLIIKQAVLSDLSKIENIKNSIIKIMNNKGNYQWNNCYPTKEIFLKDIIYNVLYVAICEKTNDICGFITISSKPNKNYDIIYDMSINSIVIYRLAVAPEFQKKGIATSLLNHAEIIAKKNNINRIRIDSSVNNEESNNLYKKLGYTLVRTFKKEKNMIDYNGELKMISYDGTYYEKIIK
jgi:ribosomal protein S18 acetylase RimI-like enzyme